MMGEKRNQDNDRDWYAKDVENDGTHRKLSPDSLLARYGPEYRPSQRQYIELPGIEPISNN